MREQLAITLNHTKVEELKIFDSSKEEKSNEINFSFSNTFFEENKREFNLTFDIKIVHKDKKIFEIKYLAKFITNIDITEEFKESHFPVVNAPAIVFPFLRAYISTLMTLSGYDAFILPTIIFFYVCDKKVKKVSLKK